MQAQILFFLNMKNTLALIKERYGHGSVQKFVKEELGIQYRTFLHQLENETVPYKTIKKLIRALDIKFTDFKDYEFITPEKRKQDKEDEKQMKLLNTPRPKKLSEIFSKK